jgi:hypothetical protein
VVAEGIEEQDQVDRRAELGCDLGQGFLIGQPMPSTEVTDMLAVLPRIIAQNTPPVPAPAPARKQVLNVAPMARRLNIDLDEEPEELPSIFAMPQKVKPVLKTAKVKATAKKTKKR